MAGLGSERERRYAHRSVEFLGREGRGRAVLSVRIPCGQRLADGDGGAIVQIGCGAPELDEGGRVKRSPGAVRSPARADIVRLQIGERRPRMARRATRPVEYPFTPSRLRREFPIDELRLGTGRRAFKYSSIARGTASGCTVNRMCGGRPARTATSAVSRISAAHLRPAASGATTTCLVVLRIAKAVVEEVPVQPVHPGPRRGDRTRSSAIPGSRCSRRGSQTRPGARGPARASGRAEWTPIARRRPRRQRPPACPRSSSPQRPGFPPTPRPGVPGHPPATRMRRRNPTRKARSLGTSVRPAAVSPARALSRSSTPGKSMTLSSWVPACAITRVFPSADQAAPQGFGRRVPGCRGARC